VEQKLQLYQKGTQLVRKTNS